MAQLGARSTSDNEVAGSTPAGSATLFRGDWSWNISFGLSLPADSRRVVVSIWRKNVQILVNRLEQACPVKMWLSKLAALDMTPLGWLSSKTNKHIIMVLFWHRLHKITPSKAPVSKNQAANEDDA